jgi:hypothetical protein
LQSDHDTAAAWIAQLNVPADVKQQWLSTPGKFIPQPAQPVRIIQHGPVAGIEN